MAGPMLIMTAPTTAADRVALGVLNSHVLEDTEVIVGVVGLLAMVTLRHDLAGINVIEQAFVGASGLDAPERAALAQASCRPGQWTRVATSRQSTSGRPGVPIPDRSTTMATTNSSSSSRAPRVRSALGFIAILAFLVTALAACSSSGDTSDQWQPEPVSEVEPDENENEPDEYEPPRTRTNPGRTRTSAPRTRTSPTRTKRTSADEDEGEEDEGEADEGEEDEGEDD